MHFRISIGSAIALGLRKGNLDCLPTTCYVMLGDRCYSNCGFCSQARDAKEGDRLSRVLWPRAEPSEIADALPSSGIKRICIQTLDYTQVVDDLEKVLLILRGKIPTSAAVNPMSKASLERLKAAGLERVGIGIDAASEELFDRVKGRTAGGRHTWEETIQSLKDAVEVFGKKRATTHIIVGLGETDRDIASTMKKLAEKGIWTSLFAATPLREAWMDLSPPPIERYRVLQAMRELILNQGCVLSDFQFDDAGKLYQLPPKWKDLDGEVFMTRGCPGCNRPYYNERPGGDMFNYPCELSGAQREEAISQILEYGVR